MAEPANQKMSDVLANYPNLYIKQSTKGWCYEQFCCETESEYNIATVEQKEQDIMYAKEHSTLLGRLCCGTQRPLNVSLWLGQGDKEKDPNAQLIAYYDRPFRCKPGGCCFIQEINAFDSMGGTALGKADIPFHCLLPVIDIKNAAGEKRFGAEAQCDCQRTCTFALKDQSGQDVGKIKKEWAGLAKECCTDADHFSVVFPPSSTADERATIIGATFLIDYNYFETSKESQ